MFFHANGLHQQRRLAAQAAPFGNLLELSKLNTAPPALLRKQDRRWFGNEERRIFSSRLTPTPCA